MKSDKLPKVMSLESASVGAEYFKCDKKNKILGCGRVERGNLNI